MWDGQPREIFGQNQKQFSMSKLVRNGQHRGLPISVMHYHREELYILQCPKIIWILKLLIRD